MVAGRLPLYEVGAFARVGPFRLLGERGASDPPILSTRNVTNCDTRLEVLSWVVDTKSLTVTLRFPKCLKLRVLLSEWQPSGICFRPYSIAACRIPRVCLVRLPSGVFLRATYVDLG